MYCQFIPCVTLILLPIFPSFYSLQSMKDFLGEAKLKEFINFVLSYL